jgi:cephalosporin hydroxylase
VTPDVTDPLVTFIAGDCGMIASVVGPARIADMPHPWLVIEDVHVNTLGILRHFRPALSHGDYIVIEDSRMKLRELAAFDAEAGADFVVDTRYTDFFGRNSTCSADSILVRL